MASATHYQLADCRELSAEEYSVLRGYAAKCIRRYLDGLEEPRELSADALEEAADNVIALAWFRLRGKFRRGRVFWESPILLWLGSIRDCAPKYSTPIGSTGWSVKSTELPAGYTKGYSVDDWVSIADTVDSFLSQIKDNTLLQRVAYLMVRHLFDDDNPQLSREDIAADCGVSVRKTYQLIDQVKFLFQILGENEDE